MVLAHRFLALACAIGLGTNAAVAAVQSSASLSNLSFELTTLDATLPGWFDLGTSRGVTSFSLDISDVGSMASEQLGKGRRGTFSFSDRVGVDLLNADGGLSLSSSGLVASGRAFGPGTAYELSASSGTSSDSAAAGNLTLSPRSMLVIRADAYVEAEASNTIPCGGCTSNQASASAFMSLTYGYHSAYGDVRYGYHGNLVAIVAARGAYTEQVFLGYKEVIDPVWGNVEWVPQYQEVVHPADFDRKVSRDSFLAVFVNTSDEAQTAKFRVSVSASGLATSPFPESVTPAVPEAGTWTLALAGLAMVAGIHWRRTRRS